MGRQLPVAFLAGLISVVTPCVLPLVPGYLSAISAVEAGRLGERGVGRRVALASHPVRPRLHRRLRGPRRGRGRDREPARQAHADRVRRLPAHRDRARLRRALPVARADFSPSSPRPCARLERPARRRLRGLRGAVHRRACSARSWCSPAARDQSSGASFSSSRTRSGSGLAFVLAGVAFTRAMAAFRWLPRPLPGAPDRRRTDPDRPRAAALLRPLLVAARCVEPRARVSRPGPDLAPETPPVRARLRRRPARAGRRRRGRGGPARTGRDAAPPSRAGGRSRRGFRGRPGTRRPRRGRAPGGSRARRARRRARRSRAPRAPRSSARPDQLQPELVRRIGHCRDLLEAAEAWW